MPALKDAFMELSQGLYVAFTDTPVVFGYTSRRAVSQYFVVGYSYTIRVTIVGPGNANMGLSCGISN
jgi:hypothetical protein